MKTLIVLLLAVPVMASCPKNCEEHYGSCACEQPPAEIAPSVKPSDEKPRHSQIPEWQDGGVKADTPPSCAYTNTCSDQKAIDAEKAGKKAAGL
jgi:hypothetical protein